MRDHLDAVGAAVLDDPAQKAAIVPDAQLDLHRSNVGDLPGLFDLRHVDVAQADLLDQSVASKSGQGSDARRQRRSGIGRMELIELDALDAESPAARFASGNERSCASVFDPVTLRSGQTAFRRDDDARAISGPGVEGGRDEPLVVAGLRGVPAVGVRRVEERNACIERGVQDRDAVGSIPVALGGKPHAAHSDARRSGWSDGRDHDRGLMGESR